MKSLKTFFTLLLFCGSLAVNAQAPLKAGFTANTVSGCSPLVVQFQDASTGNATSWKWDLGNGTSSLFQNPSTVYFNPGTYAVKQVVKNAAGVDSIIKQQYIIVYNNPVVEFSASNLLGCFPLPVSFTNASTVAGSQIGQLKWDFGDGNTSNAMHPSHTYNGAGDYTVTLQVTSDKGCVKSLSKPSLIKITAGALANFDYTATSTNCSAPVEINFQNTSIEAGVVSYEWNFGDGQRSTDKNPSHKYVTNGSCTVTLIAINAAGCRDTISKKNLINLGNSTTTFSIPDSVCINKEFNVINNSTPIPAAVVWNFGDGQESTEANPQKSYPAVGSYNVRLINKFGACEDTLIKTIKVLPKPVAAFGANRTYACNIPAAIRFNNTSSNAVAYHWDFGDGQTSNVMNPVHTYTSFGKFDVRLIVTAANGCTDTVEQMEFIRIIRPAVAILHLPVKGCVPLKVPFTSTVAVEDVVTDYYWDFGDGTTSTAAKPNHTYTKEGAYTVKLVITTTTGCKDSIEIIDAVTVAPIPQADFVANMFDVCSSTPVNFTNLSVPKGDAWLWNFHDGGTSNEANPAHQFSDTGFHDITFVVFNNGCSDTITKKNYIHVKPPFARYELAMDCNKKFTRKFTNKSIAAQTWFWDFGDGTTSTDYDPTHTFPGRGMYEVKLKVTNDGCQETRQDVIIIADEHLDFAADKPSICKGEAVAFSLLQADAQYLSRVFWNFGDGTTSDVFGNVSHVYNKTGWYRVSLLYRDVNGCIDSVVKQQYILVNGPTAAFDVPAQKICVDGTAAFNDHSTTDGLHAIDSWTWSFGDGNTQTFTGGPFRHQYKSGSTYNVTLKVTDSNGCADSVTNTAAVIVSDPHANFTTADTSSCPGSPVNFANTSTGTNLVYRWTFGDGNDATVATPAHQYTAAGRYTVNLWVSDPIGCRDSIEKINYVRITIPVAKFSMSDSVGNCPPLQVNFTNGAVAYKSVKWEFGDGSTSTLENPVHLYNIPGIFYARQIIEVPGGCTDTLTKKIIVKGPSGSFTFNPHTGCVPLTVDFKATGNSIASMIWDFNDGSTQASINKTIGYTYNTAGKFLPRLVLIDSAGCQVVVNSPDTVSAIGVTADLAMDTYRVCNEGNVQFTDQSVANDFITAHYWNFGDGKTSTESSPQHYFANAPATYTVTHIVTTATGCKDTLYLSDTIRVYAVPQISITGDKEACVPGVLNFASLITGDQNEVALRWDFGNGQFATTAAASQSYTQAGDYNVQLNLLYKNYCTNRAQRTVNIWPLPNTSAGADTYVCRDIPKQLNATGAARYTWQNSPDLSCTDCAVPLINPVQNTTYVVTGTSEHGCVKNDTINIRVRQHFDMKVMPGDTLCAGQSMRLIAAGAENYQWYPASGLDNAQIAAPRATPGVTTNYRVIGRDNDNCFADTGYATVVVYPVPQIFVGNDTTVTTGSTIQLNTKSSADINKWSWAPTTGLSCANCPKPTIAVKTNISYRVKVSNEGGCTAEDELNIVAICNGANYFIPNTFSPNNDGQNDVFYVRGKGLNRISSMRIFNRWGQAIYEKRDFMPNDPSAGWDGTFNGKPVDMDVYIYIVDVICDNSQIVPYKGNVALIR